MMSTLSDFNYYLPEHLIAQEPMPRGCSRLLHLKPPSTINDIHIQDLTDLFRPNDLIIINDTQVIKARLPIQRPSGGKGEILVERILSAHTARVQLKLSKRPKIGEVLTVPHTHTSLRVLDIHDRWVTLESTPTPLHELLEEHGSLPLPPYVKRSVTSDDTQNYQTVFASNPGAVAAPTAGLHFTTELLQALTSKGVKLAKVTLHVGAGTFLPVKTENLDEHIMHEEWFHIPSETVNLVSETRRLGGRVTAIGTTTLRALESAAQSGHLTAGMGETRLFIRPGYHFRVVDRLFTNFHLPQSTLLMLVSAFAGTEAIKNAYQHAISKNYRFFSYGDAMLIENKTEM